MAFFGKFQKAIGGVAVHYLRQKNIATFLEAVALTLDGAGDAMAAGMRLAYPLLCPADQLPVILKDRALPIYPTEPTAATRQRARKWWQLHRARGSHQGELRHLQYYFPAGAAPVIRIVHQSGDGLTATWHTLDAAGNYSVATATPSNFYFDSSPNQWSRFWVILYPPASYSRTLWDAGWLWDDGTLWDGTLGFTAAQLADLVQMVLDWKASHSALWGFILCWDPTKLNPAETAGVQDADGWWNLPDAGQWGTLKSIITGLATRPPYIEFVYDRSQ